MTYKGMAKTYLVGVVGSPVVGGLRVVSGMACGCDCTGTRPFLSRTEVGYQDCQRCDENGDGSDVGDGLAASAIRTPMMASCSDSATSIGSIRSVGSSGRSGSSFSSTIGSGFAGRTSRVRPHHRGPSSLLSTQALSCVVEVLAPIMKNLGEGEDGTTRDAVVLALSNLSIVSRDLSRAIDAEGREVMRATFGYERTRMLALGTRSEWRKELQGDPRWAYWGLPRGIFDAVHACRHRPSMLDDCTAIPEQSGERCARVRLLIQQGAIPSGQPTASKVREWRYIFVRECEDKAAMPDGPHLVKGEPVGWWRPPDTELASAHPRVAMFVVVLRELFHALYAPSSAGRLPPLEGPAPEAANGQSTSVFADIGGQCTAMGCRRIIAGPEGQMKTSKRSASIGNAALREYIETIAPNNAFYWMRAIASDHHDVRQPRHRFCSVGCHRLTLAQVAMATGIEEATLSGDGPVSSCPGANRRCPATAHRSALDRNDRVHSALCRVKRQHARNESALRDWSVEQIDRTRRVVTDMLNVDTGLLQSATYAEELMSHPIARRELPGSTRLWRSSLKEEADARVRALDCIKHGYRRRQCRMIVNQFAQSEFVQHIRSEVLSSPLLRMS